MTSDILTEALNYIDFLKDLGYYVSLSCFNSVFLPYFEKLKNYEIHLHSVCFFLKQHRKTAGKCLINKRLLGKTKITEPYYSCCYAVLLQEKANAVQMYFVVFEFFKIR